MGRVREGRREGEREGEGERMGDGGRERMRQIYMRTFVYVHTRRTTSQQLHVHVYYTKEKLPRGATFHI